MQCTNCGSNTSNPNKCTKCKHIINKSGYEASFKMDRKQKIIDMSNPPRKVPLFFKIICFSPIYMIISFSVIYSLYLILQKNGFASRNINLSLLSIIAILLFWFIKSGLLKVKLLTIGTVVMPELYERRPYGMTFSSRAGMGGSSGDTTFKGWGSDTVPKGSQKYKHYYRLTGNDGKVHEFKIKGHEDQGEYFLFNKENPKEFRRVGKYNLNMTPQNGDWKTWPNDVKSFLVFIGILVFVMPIMIFCFAV